MLVSQEKLKKYILLAGLDDPLVFEAVRFKGKLDLVSALFPKLIVELTAEADEFADILLRTSAGRAVLARRLEDDGTSGGLSDSLWAAGVARAKAKAAESRGTVPTASTTSSMRRAAPPTTWRPKKRVRRAVGVNAADHAEMSKWARRLGVALQDTPAGNLAQESGGATQRHSCWASWARPAPRRSAFVSAAGNSFPGGCSGPTASGGRPT